MEWTEDDRQKVYEEARAIREEFGRLEGDAPEIEQRRTELRKRYAELDRVLVAARNAAAAQPELVPQGVDSDVAQIAESDRKAEPPDERPLTAAGADDIVSALPARKSARSSIYCLASLILVLAVVAALGFAGGGVLGALLGGGAFLFWSALVYGVLTLTEPIERASKS